MGQNQARLKKLQEAARSMDQTGYKLYVQELWRSYDKDNNQTLSIEEARAFAKDLLKNMAQRLNRDFDLFLKEIFDHKDVDAAVNIITKDMDLNHDGKITYQEFEIELSKYVKNEDKAVAVSLLGPERKSFVDDITLSIHNEINSAIDRMLKDILPMVYTDMKALIMKDAQPLIDQAQVKIEVLKRQADQYKQKAELIEHKVVTTYQHSRWLLIPLIIAIIIPYLAMLKYLILDW